MTDRISGDDVREWNSWPGCWPALAAQLDADADLAERLEEAERELGHRRKAEIPLCSHCSDFTGSWPEVRAHVLVCHRNPMVVELARLRPLAAEAEAWEKIKTHPMRSQQVGLGWLLDGVTAWCFTTTTSVHMTAPTAVALLAKLDALMENEKQPAEVWRWRSEEGKVSEEWYETAGRCRAICERFCAPGTPVRETVAPDGTITLSPEKNDGE